MAGIALGWQAVLEARRLGRPTAEWPAAAPLWLRDLYLPLAARPFAIGHLGQSLDGFIATADGGSPYVHGPDNINHPHPTRSEKARVGKECGRSGSTRWYPGLEKK